MIQTHTGLSLEMICRRGLSILIYKMAGKVVRNKAYVNTDDNMVGKE